MGWKHFQDKMRKEYEDNYIIQGLGGASLLIVALGNPGLPFINGLVAFLGVIHTVKAYDTYKEGGRDKDKGGE